MFQPILSPYLDFQLHYPKQKQNCVPNKIVIYSPYNSGSNLLQNLLLKIFPKIQYSIESLPWKHTIQPSYLSNHLHILIIKNPFSWFQSIIKSPYDLKWDGTYHLFDQKEILFYTKDNGIKTFQNIYQMWIHYYQLYQDFLKKTGHSYVILLTYEDLLYHTEDVIIFFSKIWNYPFYLEDRILIKQILEKPAKDHGYCNDYQTSIHINQIDNLKSNYQPKIISSFFEETNKISIHTIHQKLWKLNQFKST